MAKFINENGLIKLVKSMCDNINSTIGSVYYSLTGQIDSIRPLKIVSYEELKMLRDSGMLLPGQQYRITDYITTTTQEDTQSAGHQFDIIVTADTENTLNEKARVCLHESDAYFSENGANLEAWQIWYCLDNDTNRFAWADSTNGKGVIYRMIDEWDNDCPYDFKNMLFKHPHDVTTYPDYYYTFSVIIDGNIKDYSSSQGLYSIQSSISRDQKFCYNNTMKKYSFNLKQYLNKNVFLNSLASCKCHSNSFELNCYSNSFELNCNYNTFGNYCYSNSFGYNCNSNTFGNYCSDNTIGNGCSDNTFGDECRSNTFRYMYRYFTLGNGTQHVIFYYTTEPANKYVQNYRTAQGLQGTKSNKLTVEVTPGLSYENKIARNSNGDVVIYCEADLIYVPTSESPTGTTLNYSLKNQTELYYNSETKSDIFVEGNSYFDDSVTVSSHTYDEDQKIGVVVFDGRVSSEMIAEAYPSLEILMVK